MTIKNEIPGMIINEDTQKIKRWQSKYWKKFSIPEYDKLGVSEEIHHKDLMLPAGRNMDGYKVGGLAAEECINLGLSITNKKLSKDKNLLVLPSGYGREYRYLIKKYNECNLYCSDIEIESVDFCVEKFGGTGIHSKHDINSLKVDVKFDAIWVGSLFSHLNLQKWHEFFKFFSNVLADDGLLIMTTEGRMVTRMVEFGDNAGISDEKKNKMLEGYHKEGFGHVTYDNSAYYNSLDEVGNYYGRTLVKAEFVMNFLKDYPELRLVSYIPDFWGARQDVYIFQKDLLYMECFK